jgi:hypothetical protein
MGKITSEIYGGLDDRLKTSNATKETTMKKTMLAKKKVAPKNKVKKLQDSSVLDTAGGEMPDPSDCSVQSRKDVRYAFHRT